jgi:hypothetical protein
MLRHRAIRLSAAGVVVAAALSSAWVIAMGALKVGADDVGPTPLSTKLAWALSEIPLWVLQSIAAFPFRNQASHPLVYASFFTLFAGFVLMALTLSRGTRPAFGLIACIALSVAVPFVSSVQSYRYHQGAWQGRYGLPLAVGIVLLAGLCLDLRRREPAHPMIVAGLVLFLIPHVLAPTVVLVDENKHSPLSGTAAWLQPSPWLTALVAAAAVLIAWYGAAFREEPSRRT